MRLPTLAALGGALILVLSGCGGAVPAAKSRATATSLAGLHASSMNLVRIGFCDLVPAAAVRTALGGPGSASQQWKSGDRPPADHSADDVAHEFGCAWTRGRHTASAWVFARPVTAGFAQTVIADARSRQGCSTRSGARFGAPDLIQTCTTSSDSRERRAGLFGDTWLTCEVSGPSRQAARLADGWCAAVADALDRG